MDQMVLILQMACLRQNHLSILHHFAPLSVNGALFTTILHYWQLMVHNFHKVGYHFALLAINGALFSTILHYWQLL